MKIVSIFTVTQNFTKKVRYVNKQKEKKNMKYMKQMDVQILYMKYIVLIS